MDLRALAAAVADCLASFPSRMDRSGVGREFLFSKKRLEIQKPVYTLQPVAKLRTATK